MGVAATLPELSEWTLLIFILELLSEVRSDCQEILESLRF